MSRYEELIAELSSATNDSRWVECENSHALNSRGHRVHGTVISCATKESNEQASLKPVLINGLVVIYGPTPRIVASAEVITDGQNRSPQFRDSTADSIKTPGLDIGSTQDWAVELEENMFPAECY